MKISVLRQQAKNPLRVNIFVDNKYCFSLSLDQLAKYGLKKGDNLSAADIKKYKKISEDGKVAARSLAWVLKRPHSTREFKDYLKRKKTDDKLIEELTGDFGQKGYINDLEFGRWLTEIRMRAGRSNRAIKAELFKKGLSAEDIETILPQGGQSEITRLKTLLNKKKNLSRYQNNPQKLTQYLARQGFSYELIKQALDD